MLIKDCVLTKTNKMICKANSRTHNVSVAKTFLRSDSLHRKRRPNSVHVVFHLFFKKCAMNQYISLHFLNQLKLMLFIPNKQTLFPQ